MIISENTPGTFSYSYLLILSAHYVKSNPHLQGAPRLHLVLRQLFPSAPSTQHHHLPRYKGFEDLELTLTHPAA